MLDNYNGPTGSNFLHWIKKPEWALTLRDEVIATGPDLFALMKTVTLDGSRIKEYRIVAPNGVRMDIPTAIKIDDLA